MSVHACIFTYRNSLENKVSSSDSPSLCAWWYAFVTYAWEMDVGDQPISAQIRAVANLC